MNKKKSGTIYYQQRYREQPKVKEMTNKKENPIENPQRTRKENGNISEIGWLNPTKRTLRWLGLPPVRHQDGEKTYSEKLDDQAA